MKRWERLRSIIEKVSRFIYKFIYNCLIRIDHKYKSYFYTDLLIKVIFFTIVFFILFFIFTLILSAYKLSIEEIIIYKHKLFLKKIQYFYLLLIMKYFYYVVLISEFFPKIWSIAMFEEYEDSELKIFVDLVFTYFSDLKSDPIVFLITIACIWMLVLIHTAILLAIWFIKLDPINHDWLDIIEGIFDYILVHMFIWCGIILYVGMCLELFTLFF